MKKFRSGLTLRISLTFACFAGLLLLSVGVLSYSSGRNALENAAVSELLSSAIGKESHINEWLRDTVEDIETRASSPALQAATLDLVGTDRQHAASHDAYHRVIAELLPRSLMQKRKRVVLAIANPRTGQLVAATDHSIEGKSAATESYFNIGVNKSSLQTPFTSALLGRPVIAVATPIRATGGPVVGVLIAWIELSELNNIVQQRTGQHQSDDAYVVNADRRFVTQPRFMKQSVVLTQSANTEAVNRALAGQSGVLLANDYNDLPAIIVYRWLPEQRLALITLITQAEAFALANEFRVAILFISVLVLLLASGLSIALARTIVQPIRTLQEGVSRFGQGEFTLRLPVTSDNELGQLAHEFNSMAESINQTGRELQQNASQLELRVQERTRTLKRQADLLELAHDAIIVRRADGIIDYWNHGAKEIYGWSHHDAKGRHIDDLLQTKLTVAYEKFNSDLFATGRWEGELTHTRRDGRIIVVASRQAVRYDDKGKPVAILEINSDISDRKFVEKQLMQAKEAAEAATNAKSDFLANMSHEIRTPMNGVIGLTNLVLKTPMSSRQREYLDLIKSSADSLLRLLNDILDFSKMEARKLELDIVDFDLREMIGNTLKAFSANANEKSIELIHQVMPDVPRWIKGDAGRLAQIIVNLTGNALKFTKEGEVVVRVAQQSNDKEGTTLRFSVSDSGIGIPKEKQNHIFNAFAQADSSTTREYGGTGLGLAIVAQLVALMNGEIDIDSTPGKGTVFHFTALFSHSDLQFAPSTNKSEEFAQLKNRSILVVDDNRTSRMTLAEILSNWSMHPVLAADADQAFQYVRQFAEQQQPFSIILIDARMPNFDGFELAVAIKADPSFKSVIIMMLSTNDLDEDIARCEQIGIEHFMYKPVKQSELFDAIATATGSAAIARHTKPSIQTHLIPPHSRALNVLIAEDNVVNQRLVSDILQERGHTFMIANNGLEALLLHEQYTFDVILMDGQMPEMDGYQATREIRRQEQRTGRHTRIIAVTAHAMKEDRALCLSTGMDDYVTKPIDADHLIARLEWQSAFESTVDAVHPIRVTDSIEPLAQALAFDIEGALKRVRGKVPLLKELLSVLLQDLPHALVEIDTAVSNDDADQLERTAHRLRGAVSTICAEAVSEAAMQIEKLGRSRALSDAPIAVDNLHRHVAALVTEMHTYLGEPA